MRRMAVMLAGAMVFVLTIAQTAFAEYTESPPPTNVVEGAGGAGGETAFTGGDVSAAAFVAIALAAIGLVVLLVARRRAIRS